MRPLARFRNNREGTAAVEFALLAPVLVTMYFGVAELTQGLMASQRVSGVASSIGDLTAQAASTTPAALTDIFNVGKTLMQPYPASSGQLTMRLTRVTVDSTNTPKVDWSVGQGMTGLAKGSTVSLPSAPKVNPGDPTLPFIGAGQSVIMAEAHYRFQSPVGEYLPSTSDMHDTLYLSPRQGTSVACPAC